MRDRRPAASRHRTTASVRSMPNVVDAHLQVWNPDTVHYPWMTAENAAVHRTYRVPDIEDHWPTRTSPGWSSCRPRTTARTPAHALPGPLLVPASPESWRGSRSTPRRRRDAAGHVAARTDRRHRSPGTRRSRPRLVARRRRRRQPDAPDRAPADPRPHGAHDGSPGPRRHPHREPPRPHGRPRPPRRPPARRAAGRRTGTPGRAGPPCSAPWRRCRTSSPSCPG